MRIFEPSRQGYVWIGGPTFGKRAKKLIYDRSWDRPCSPGFVLEVLVLALCSLEEMLRDLHAGNFDRRRAHNVKKGSVSVLAILARFRKIVETEYDSDDPKCRAGVEATLEYLEYLGAGELVSEIREALLPEK